MTHGMPDFPNPHCTCRARHQPGSAVYEAHVGRFEPGIRVDPSGPPYRIVDQPPPIPNASVPVWDLVMADMEERDRVGRARYGTPLQTHNGRDALVDLYQELLDAVVYIRQVIEERKR